jgi:hypothetical protein
MADVGVLVGGPAIALQDPANTPFFCRRAVEAISHHWPAGNPRTRWAMAQTALRLEEGFFKDLRESGGETRHGKFELVTGEHRLALLRAAWIVAGRFVVLLDSEASTLSNEFATLTALP